MKFDLPHTYSQYGEDRWIADNLDLPRTGCFIEVGAADGIRNSNTFALEQVGWFGVAIDPDPRNAERLARNRKWPLTAAVSSALTISRFALPSDPTLGALAPSGDPREPGLRVPCLSLAVVRRAYGITALDLLSVDTEGTEIDVLDSLDWSVCPPRIVVVEFNTLGRPDNSGNVLQWFAGKPYTMRHRTVANFVFTHD
jgi:FkbM family methyltransferase